MKEAMSETEEEVFSKKGQSEVIVPQYISILLQV